MSSVKKPKQKQQHQKEAESIELGDSTGFALPALYLLE
jgi:hypothetical protein